MNIRVTTKHVNDTSGDHHEANIGRLSNTEKYKGESIQGVKPDLFGGNSHIEVKAVLHNQSVGVSIEQVLGMKRLEELNDITNYYALCFYRILGPKKLSELLKKGEIVSMQEFLNMQKVAMSQVITETIFLFPITCIIDYFKERTDKRTGKRISTKRQGTQRSSNQGPIKDYFDESEKSKSIIEIPETQIYIIGDEMNQRVQGIIESS